MAAALRLHNSWKTTATATTPQQQAAGIEVLFPLWPAGGVLQGGPSV